MADNHKEEPLEITVREDPVSNTWRFTYKGHEVEVERAHGFVKIDGQIHETESVKGLRDVEELRGQPLDVIDYLIHRHEESQTTPDKALQAHKDTTPPPNSASGGEGHAKPEQRNPEEEAKAQPGVKDTLNTEQAAEYLHLSPKTLETMRSRGGGPPYVKFGRRVIYRRKDLEAWLAERVRHSTS